MGCNKSKMLNHQFIFRKFCLNNDYQGRNKLRINDFDDQILIKILSMLSLREKLAVERVCKRWQKLLRQLLQQPVSLKMGEHSIKCKCKCTHYPSCEFDPHKQFERDQCGYIVYPTKIFLRIIKLCTNIRCLNLSHIQFNDDIIEAIIDNCHQLECLHLYDIRCNDDDDEDLMDTSGSAPDSAASNKSNKEDHANSSVDSNIKSNSKDKNKDKDKDNKGINKSIDEITVENSDSDQTKPKAVQTIIKIKSKVWEKFVMYFGPRLKSLSIGALTEIEQFDIILLFKYCNILEELRINNELDIVPYLAIIRRTVQRIYINCEHGIGLECISLLSFRKYAEKVLELGRIDVPCELIDSVLSTVGCNFTNLKKLMVRFRPYDLDVSTPASVLFDSLDELSLQFMSGNADVIFQTIVSLGWQSIKCLTIQYASLTTESVLQIAFNLPQLNKLVLHAVEFRCDHLSKRYGHRLCIECARLCWDTISRLPNLRHLRLHRAIIDDEICSALLNMKLLRCLDLHYCSNVTRTIVDICAQLARTYCKGEWFKLSIVSRGMVTFDDNQSHQEDSHHSNHKETDPLPNNLKIDVKVAFKLQ